MAIVIDGKKIADNILNNIQYKIKGFINKPRLSIIIVGNSSASLLYIKKKTEACNKAGIQIQLEKFNEGIEESSLLEVIERNNKDKSINGIIVQLPLPKYVNEERILNTIDYYKDVDGFHVKNIGELALNYRVPTFIPCTALSCVKILESINIDLKGKNVTIIGNSNIVGLPLNLLLLKKGSTVTVCHIDTIDLPSHTKNADIIISACGQPEMIKKEWIKEKCVIIDVGINYIDDSTKKSGKKLVGDVDFDNVKEKASYITPVPGGVGPLTVAMLISNTLKAYEIQNNFYCLIDNFSILEK